MSLSTHRGRARSARRSRASRTSWSRSGRGGERGAAGQSARSPPYAQRDGGGRDCCIPCGGASLPNDAPSRPTRKSTYPALVSPPVALALDVFARSVAEIGRADDDDLESPGPGLVAAPGTGRDAHRVPLLSARRSRRRASSARSRAGPRTPPPASCACGRTESDSRAGRAGSPGRIARARAAGSPSGIQGPARHRTWIRRPPGPSLRFLSVNGTVAIVWCPCGGRRSDASRAAVPVPSRRRSGVRQWVLLSMRGAVPARVLLRAR